MIEFDGEGFAYAVLGMVEQVYDTGELRWQKRADGVFLQKKFQCVGIKDNKAYERIEWRDVPVVEENSTSTTEKLTCAMCGGRRGELNADERWEECRRCNGSGYV